LSGRGLCDEPITRPEEFYRLWCIVVCDQETLCDEEAIDCTGLPEPGGGGERERSVRVYI
jgi:hypothetical protein